MIKMKGGIKMKNKTLGIVAVSMFLLLAVGVSAFGFGKMNALDEEQRNELISAIENNDFESWKGIMQGKITEENFNKQVLRHQERAQHRESIKEARESGNWEEIQELKAQFGKGMHKRNANPGNCPFAQPISEQTAE
jgi:hypothetical protein